MASAKIVEAKMADILLHKESPYVFKRDEEERARLNNQHDSLVYFAGERILHAPLDPSSILRVADVGTGTGIWLENFAEYLSAFPSHEPRRYDGYDLSADHFPEDFQLGEGFSYSIQDILEPFPEKLKGTYDLVHVRLLVAALKEGDVEIAVRNLGGLLKPGGWIQWEELDGETWGGRVQAPSVIEMHKIIMGHLNRKGMEKHVPSAFLEAAKKNPELENSQDVEFNSQGRGPGKIQGFNWACLWSYARATKMILLGGGREGAEEKAERLLADAKKEVETNGFIWDTDFHVLLAQKRKKEVDIFESASGGLC